MSGSQQNIVDGSPSMRVRSMPDRTRKRSKNTKALESWDNEGGTTSGAPQEDRDKPVTLTEKEEHVLRSLGVAVIMKWNDLPTDTQRELFGAAVSTSEPRTKIELKEQIARFLHTHKDDMPR
jgi:hypothetical protein